MSFLKKSAVCLVIPVFLTTGCLSNSDGVSGQVDPRLKENSFEYKSYLTSCVVGGAIGMLAGLVLADDKVVGSLAGAAGGCAAGMGSNFILDSVRKNYKSKEEQINATHEMLSAENAKLKNINELARLIQQEQREELSKIDKAEMNDIARQREVKKLIADADANIQSLRDNLKATEQIQTEYTEVREKIIGKDKLSKAEKLALENLDKEIARTSEENALLKEQINLLTAHRNSMHDAYIMPS